MFSESECTQNLFILFITYKMLFLSYIRIYEILEYIIISKMNDTT